MEIHQSLTVYLENDIYVCVYIYILYTGTHTSPPPHKSQELFPAQIRTSNTFSHRPSWDLPRLFLKPLQHWAPRRFSSDRGSAATALNFYLLFEPRLRAREPQGGETPQGEKPTLRGETSQGEGAPLRGNRPQGGGTP